MEQFFAINIERLDISKFENQMIVVDKIDKNIHVLNETASIIFDYIRIPRKKSEIYDYFVSLFGENDNIIDDINEIINTFYHNNMIITI